MINSSDLFLELKKQRANKNVLRTEQSNILRKEANKPLESLHQTNKKALQEVSDPFEAILTGLLSGLGEGVVKELCEIDYTNKWLDWANQTMDQAVLQQIQQNKVQDFFTQHAGVLGELASKIKNLRPEQAKNLLRPFFEEMSKDVGFFVGDLIDVNPANGNVTFQQNDGRIGQYSLYDLFPKLKEQMIYDNSINGQKDLLSEENIIKTHQQEYTDALQLQRQALEEQQRHNRVIEEQQKQKIQQGTIDQIALNEGSYRKMYEEKIKNSDKNAQRYAQIDEELQDQKRELEFTLTTLKKLNKLHKDLDTVHLIGALNPTKIGEIARGIYTGLGIGEDSIKLRNLIQPVEALTMDFFNRKTREDLLGTGTQTDQDMKLYREKVLVKFFSSPSQWQKELKTRVDRIAEKYKKISKKQAENRKNWERVYEPYDVFKNRIIEGDLA